MEIEEEETEVEVEAEEESEKQSPRNDITPSILNLHLRNPTSTNLFPSITRIPEKHTHHRKHRASASIRHRRPSATLLLHQQKSYSVHTAELYWKLGSGRSEVYLPVDATIL